MSLKDKIIQRLDELFNPLAKTARQLSEFLTAAECGDIETLGKYIKKRNFTTSDSEASQMAMIAAAKAGRMTAVKFLLAQGVPATSSFDGKTAIAAARENGHQAVVEFLEFSSNRSAAVPLEAVLNDFEERSLQNPHALLGFISASKGTKFMASTLKTLFKHAGKPVPKELEKTQAATYEISRGELASLAYSAAKRSGDGVISSATIWLKTRLH